MANVVIVVGAAYFFAFLTDYFVSGASDCDY